MATNGSNPSVCSGAGQEESPPHPSLPSLSPPRDTNEDLYTWMAKQQEFTESKREKVVHSHLRNSVVSLYSYGNNSVDIYINLSSVKFL